MISQLILKKTENSSLDTSQEKNQYLNYQIINGNLYLQKEQKENKQG